MDISGRYIGYRLRKARKRMGYTHADVMSALDFRSGNRISQWEKGTRIPSIKNILKLSVLYKTLPDDLFYELRQEAIKSIEHFHKRKRKVESNKQRHPP
jgi:transcriptional regulator with XRE-family HTH domain